MKEWRINLLYKLLLFILFLVSPFFLLNFFNETNLPIRNYIYIYAFELVVFLFSYFMYEVRVRSFYNRLIKKTYLLNEKYGIKNSKYKKYLGLDSFSSFEYFFNEEIDKVFSELDYYKNAFNKDETKKNSESNNSKNEIHSMVEELKHLKHMNELETDLLKRGNEFLNEIKKAILSYNTFFEEVSFYLSKHFVVEELLIGQKNIDTYKIFHKLSDKLDEDSKLQYTDLDNLNCGIYSDHRINETYNYEVIFVIKIEEKLHGFIMFNLANKEYLKIGKIKSIMEEIFNVLIILLDFYYKQKGKDEKIEKLSCDVKKLNNQLKETDANLDIHLEQMSNMYEEIVTLYEVGKKLGKIYKKHNIAKTILDTLLDITNTEFAIVYEYHHNELIINKFINVKSKELIKEFKEEVYLKNIFFDMKKIEKPIIINDIKKYEGYNALPTEIKKYVKNFVEAPIFVNEEVKGGVILFNKSEEEFTAANVNLITSLINQMAIAVQNIDYFKNEIDRQKEEEQLKIASLIQANLFPQFMPKFEKIGFYGLNVPAKAVGGDYYDLVKINDNTLIGFIADVSGKGMPAALLVSMVRTIFRMVVEELEEYAPEIILKRVNSVLLKENLGGRFVTALCFKYIEDKNLLETASAGHDPFIIYKYNEKKIYTYPSDNIVLGVMEEDYQRVDLEFTGNDIALFYTDGVVEARRDDGAFYGLDKVFKIIENNIDSDANAIGSALYGDVKNFVQNAKQNDDITILVAKGGNFERT